MSDKDLEKLILIPADSIALEGSLSIPEGAQGLVIFAHGSGSSRLSKRNNFVANFLCKAGLGTLLFDLLTEAEDEVYENRFDIPRLAQRLEKATFWIKKQPAIANFRIGYFGASTGAAAALVAAADMGESIGAVVSRGGRPDLAKEVLDKVVSPTLLIVGGNDHTVIELNQIAYKRLACKKNLEIVPNATHLFEEPGTLEEVACLAAEWFTAHLKPHGTR